MSREQLSLRELELLQELNEIAVKTDNLNENIDEKFGSNRVCWKMEINVT